MTQKTPAGYTPLTCGTLPAYLSAHLPDDILPGGTPESWQTEDCLLYTSPSPRDRQKSRMPSSA